MRQALYIIIVLLFSNCEISKTNSIMDKNSLEYKAFMAQEHRFEINGCTLKYNGKPFKLGMTIKEMENVFGKYDERLLWKNNKRLLTKNEKRLFWKNENLNVTFSNDRAIYIRITIEKHVFIKRDEDDKVVLQMTFQGVPLLMYNNFVLYRDEKMQDFIKKSTNTFDDFFIHDDGYRLYNKVCNLRLDFRSPVVYHRIGGGHLSVRGDWDLNKTYPIEAISISYIDK